jgi:DNA-binding winged helix-turn-helix (wHTH) protein
MARFSVRALGFPEIRRDDRLSALSLRKGLALLVYLAEAKGSVGRDVLATMFWPESPEDVVRARLRRLLHRLQLTLGDDVLTTDRSTVRGRQQSICSSIPNCSSRPATAASSKRRAVFIAATEQRLWCHVLAARPISSAHYRKSPGFIRSLRSHGQLEAVGNPSRAP